MTNCISGYVRSFTAHDAGMDILTDHDRIHLSSAQPCQISIDIEHKFSCCSCKKTVKKLYSQAYCFPCSQKLACCDLCVLKPVLCHYDMGTCREPEWGKEFCMTPHIVYIAWTSDIKVGVTRKHRLLTRWREQGAMMAAALFETTSRHQAGILEDQLRQYYRDQTAWRKMLQCQHVPTEYFTNIFHEAVVHVELFTKKSALNYEPHTLHYPMHGDIKVASLGQPNNAYTIEDQLIGIKGHYLLFTSGVLSVRTLMGRHISYRGPTAPS